MKLTVQVYLSSGRVFEYDIEESDGSGRAREHADAIIRTGYRNVIDGVLTHYAPHKVDKVKVIGEGITTMYPDRERGT